jgi:hypothetical protein
MSSNAYVPAQTGVYGMLINADNVPTISNYWQVYVRIDNTYVFWLLHEQPMQSKWVSSK